MTATLGSIKAEIPIPLERPRQQSMMMSSTNCRFVRPSRIREDGHPSIDI